MGNRVLVQLKDNHGVSPVLYGHWSGHDGKEWLTKLKEKMGSRLDDLSYSFARLVQLAVTDDDVTGFGVWNAEKEIGSANSHGDAGCYVMDVVTGEITHSG